MMKEVISAMEYLHSRKIIHRDIKLENILVDAEEHIKLMDFGLSRHVARMSAVAGKLTTRIGTDIYMAPELCLDQQDYDEKCDVYSFGMVLWIVFTQNDDPYGDDVGVEFKVANNPNYRPDLTLLSSWLPKNLQWITKCCKKCWSEKPYRRPNFSEIDEMFRVVKDNNTEEERRRKMELERREKYSNFLNDEMNEDNFVEFNVLEVEKEKEEETSEEDDESSASTSTSSSDDENIEYYREKKKKEKQKKRSNQESSDLNFEVLRKEFRSKEEGYLEKIDELEETIFLLEKQLVGLKKKKENEEVVVLFEKKKKKSSSEEEDSESSSGEISTKGSEEEEEEGTDDESSNYSSSDET